MLTDEQLGFGGFEVPETDDIDKPKVIGHSTYFESGGCRVSTAVEGGVAVTVNGGNGDPDMIFIRPSKDGLEIITRFKLADKAREMAQVNWHVTWEELALAGFKTVTLP